MLRIFLALMMISTRTLGADFPLMHRNLNGVFLETLVGYENFELTSGNYIDCKVSSYDSPPVSFYHCTPVDVYITLRGASGIQRIVFRKSMLQDGYYKGQHIHQMTLVGEIAGHPRIPDGEPVHLYFWYPVEDSKKLRGYVAFKNLDLSKPFVLGD